MKLQSHIYVWCFLDRCRCAIKHKAKYIFGSPTSVQRTRANVFVYTKRWRLELWGERGRERELAIVPKWQRKHFFFFLPTTLVGRAQVQCCCCKCLFTGRHPWTMNTVLEYIARRFCHHNSESQHIYVHWFFRYQTFRPARNILIHKFSIKLRASGFDWRNTWNVTCVRNSCFCGKNYWYRWWFE